MQSEPLTITINRLIADYGYSTILRRLAQNLRNDPSLETFSRVHSARTLTRIADRVRDLELSEREDRSQSREDADA